MRTPHNLLLATIRATTRSSCTCCCLRTFCLSEEPRDLIGRFELVSKRQLQGILGYENHPTRCLPDSYSGPVSWSYQLRPELANQLTMRSSKNATGHPWAHNHSEIRRGSGAGASTKAVEPLDLYLTRTEA